MTEWYEDQDQDTDWQQAQLDDEQEQWLIEEQRKIALQVMNNLLELHKTKWSK